MLRERWAAALSREDEQLQSVRRALFGEGGCGEGGRGEGGCGEGGCGEGGFGEGGCGEGGFGEGGCGRSRVAVYDDLRRPDQFRGSLHYR